MAEQTQITWHYTSEELPQKYGKYIVCTACGTIITSYTEYEDGEYHFRSSKPIIAWAEISTPLRLNNDYIAILSKIEKAKNEIKRLQAQLKETETTL